MSKNNTKDNSVTKAPKTLSWADARTLLIVVFMVGGVLGVIGGYFAAIDITNSMRRNFVAEQQAITAVATKKANQ